MQKDPKDNIAKIHRTALSGWLKFTWLLFIRRHSCYHMWLCC